MRIFKRISMMLSFVISMGSLSQTFAYNTNPSVNEVLGVIDSVKPGARNGMLVSGWACSAYRSDSITVHVYGQLGGAYIYLGAGVANRPAEPAVRNACRNGLVYHRFSFFVPISGSLVAARNGGYLVTIFGISPVGGGNNSLDNSNSAFRVNF